MAAENGYSYVMNNLIALDQQLNALTRGSCDETLSSRAYRRAGDQRSGVKEGMAWICFEALVNALFFWDVGPHGEKHCQLANMVELLGGHLPKSMARNLILR